MFLGILLCVLLICGLAVIVLLWMEPAESAAEGVLVGLVETAGCVARWLLRLFDLGCGVDSGSIPWADLLRCVARRLVADLEPLYSSSFPWALDHLSVRTL